MAHNGKVSRGNSNQVWIWGWLWKSHGQRCLNRFRGYQRMILLEFTNMKFQRSLPPSYTMGASLGRISGSGVGMGLCWGFGYRDGSGASGDVYDPDNGAGAAFGDGNIYGEGSGAGEGNGKGPK